MLHLGPWTLLEGEWRRGTLSVESGVPTSFSPQVEEGLDARGVVLPALTNAHTHLGDAFITDPPEGTLQELVAPPDGYKHRRLGEATDAEVLEGMGAALTTMTASGTTRFSDFREGGLPGTRLEACVGRPVDPTIFGRPAAGAGDQDEWGRLLRVVDGIGASGLGDADPAALREWSRAARSAHLPFALHASEGRREDIDAILDLDPAVLVHMTSATVDDFAASAEAGVPVVVCPRSNARFGLVPDIPGMREAGLTVWLGTDNAMFHGPDMLAEMRHLARMRWQGETLSAEDVFRMAMQARKPLNEGERLGVELGQPSDLAVLPIPGDEPTFQDVLASGSSAIAVVQAGVFWEVHGDRIEARAPPGG
jgi:cytosine/adenosine deaminase-related metal-dependent hydrolase